MGKKYWISRLVVVVIVLALFALRQAGYIGALVQVLLTVAALLYLWRFWPAEPKEKTTDSQK